MWSSALIGTLCIDQVLNYLNEPYINSLQTLVSVHNVLLIAVLLDVVLLENLVSFRYDSDYLFLKIYYPLSKSSSQLNEYEMVLYDKFVRHAESCGFIKAGQHTQIKGFAEIRADTEKLRDEVSKVHHQIKNNLHVLDFHTRAIEDWAEHASNMIMNVESRTGQLESFALAATPCSIGHQFRLLVLRKISIC